MSSSNNQATVTITSQILKLHDEGMSTGDIARTLGIRFQHAYNVLQSKGRTLEVRDRSNTKTAEMLRLHEEGKTTGEIARQMGVTFQFVYNTLVRKGKITSKK